MLLRERKVKREWREEKDGRRQTFQRKENRFVPIRGAVISLQGANQIGTSAVLERSLPYLAEAGFWSWRPLSYLSRRCSRYRSVLFCFGRHASFLSLVLAVSAPISLYLSLSSRRCGHIHFPPSIRHFQGHVLIRPHVSSFPGQLIDALNSPYFSLSK